MNIHLLAAGLALCTSLHLNCSKFDSVQFDFAVMEKPPVNDVAEVGVPHTGQEGQNYATMMCNVVNATYKAINPDKFKGPLYAIPIYEYQMYNGAWGTEYVCQLNPEMV